MPIAFATFAARKRAFVFLYAQFVQGDIGLFLVFYVFPYTVLFSVTYRSVHPFFFCSQLAHPPPAPPAHPISHSHADPYPAPH